MLDATIEIETFDNRCLEVPLIVAEMSEFIRGLTEENQNRAVRVKLAHYSCTFLIVQKIVCFLEQHQCFMITCDTTSHGREIIDNFLVDLDEDEIVNVVLALDFLDIFNLRTAIAKRIGTVHVFLDSPTALCTLIESKDRKSVV